MKMGQSMKGTIHQNEIPVPETEISRHVDMEQE